MALNIHIMYKNIFLIISLLIFAINSFCQISYPHLLVDESDKQKIFQKIDDQPWANIILNEELNKIWPYVKRHQTHPEWILSRYLMNWWEGKRYTHAYNNGSGHYLVDYSGDAPVPTVRVSIHKRPLRNFRLSMKGNILSQEIILLRYKWMR